MTRHDTPSSCNSDTVPIRLHYNSDGAAKETTKREGISTLLLQSREHITDVDPHEPE
jgi:hypothetical protein